MKRTVIAATIILVAIVLTSVFAALQLFRKTETPIYVGVEVAYEHGTATDVEVMVDRIRHYANLIVIGSLDISFNETALNETCDYVSNAGLNFIVLFTDSTKYTYSIFDWMSAAKQKYGDKFLGVYRYDEPGGNQIDQGPEILVDNATSYNDAASQYISGLGGLISFYRGYAPQVFTADYALQWFDYECNYSAVFSEFVSNNTREIAVAQCRGATSSFGRDWGVMIAWKYDAQPYIEPSTEMYDDMVSAYKAGAKYVIVFDFPKLNTYGILTDDHFNAIRQFWEYVNEKPQDFGSQKATTAYVLPEDYGFGLRRADDRIWGLFGPDELSAKVWSDVNKLVGQYGFGLDIVFDEVGVVNAARSRYGRLIFWNETVT